jgi:uncharacterized protein (DUF427 family)
MATASWNGAVIARSDDIVVAEITGRVAFWRGVTVAAD